MTRRPYTRGPWPFPASCLGTELARAEGTVGMSRSLIPENLTEDYVVEERLEVWLETGM